MYLCVSVAEALIVAMLKDLAKVVDHLRSDILLAFVLIQNVVAIFIAEQFHHCVGHLNDGIRTLALVSSCKEFDSIVVNRHQIDIARLFFLCPSPSPGVHSDSRPSSQ